MEKLKSVYSPNFPTRSLFPWHFIHGAFLERLKLCEKYFIGFQIKAIELHIQQFHNLRAAEKQVLFHLRQLVAQRYIEKFVLQPIRKEDCLVPGVYLDGTQLSFSRGPTNGVLFSESFSGRQQIGSYNERQQKLGQNWLDRFTADATFQVVPTRWTSLEGWFKYSVHVVWGFSNSMAFQGCFHCCHLKSQRSISKVSNLFLV